HQESAPQSRRGHHRHRLRHRLQTGGLMRLFPTLRGRLIAMVAALVAVMIGSVAVISTRVAHYEIRKFDVAVATGGSPRPASILSFQNERLSPPTPGTIAAYYRERGTWAGVQPAI